MKLDLSIWTRGVLRDKDGRRFRFGDIPDNYKAQTVNIVIRKDADGGMQIRREPIPPMPEELKLVIEEMK